MENETISAEVEEITEVTPTETEFVSQTIVTTAEELNRALKLSVKPPMRRPIPILQMAKITPDAVTVTDLDLWSEIDFDADGEEGVEFLIPYRKVVDALKGEKGKLTISTLPNHWIRLEIGECEFKLQSMSLSSFPSRPAPIVPTLDIPGEMFKKMIDRAIIAVSHEESRYTLNGALIETDCGKVRMVGTDDHRLSLDEHELRGEIEKGTIIRADALDYLRTRIGAYVGIGRAEDWLMFSTKELRLWSRRLIGQFPEYHAVLPTLLPMTVEIPSGKDLSAVLARVAKCADEQSGATKWEFGPFGAKVSASSPKTGSASAGIKGAVTSGVIQVKNPAFGFDEGQSEDVPEKIDTDSRTIGLNAAYIMDFLKVAGDVPVTVRLRDSLSSCVWSALDGWSYVVGLMRI